MNEVLTKAAVHRVSGRTVNQVAIFLPSDYLCKYRKGFSGFPQSPFPRTFRTQMTLPLTQQKLQRSPARMCLYCGILLRDVLHLFTLQGCVSIAVYSFEMCYIYLFTLQGCVSIVVYYFETCYICSLCKDVLHFFLVAFV